MMPMMSPGRGHRLCIGRRDAREQGASFARLTQVLGAVAQSGSAPRSHRGGQGFKSPQLHPRYCRSDGLFDFCSSTLKPLREPSRRLSVWLRLRAVATAKTALTSITGRTAGTAPFTRPAPDVGAGVVSLGFRRGRQADPQEGQRPDADRGRGQAQGAALRASGLLRPTRWMRLWPTGWLRVCRAVRPRRSKSTGTRSGWCSPRRWGLNMSRTTCGGTFGGSPRRLGSGPLGAEGAADLVRQHDDLPGRAS